MNKSIPLVDLSLQHEQIAEELDLSWSGILRRMSFVQGSEVADFEASYARFVGARHCVTVASGTDALELALRAIGIRRGDEVIVPTNSFVASAFAVMRLGAAPILVDVTRDSLLIDPDSVADRMGPRTRAIMAVHLFGQMAPMMELRRLAGDRLVLLEDAAQAHGATQDGVSAGAHGETAATSFYPGKNLGAYGDGGAVLTNSAQVARRVRAIRNHGSEDRYRHPEVGFNSRMDTLQAAVLLAKLRHLDDWNEQRREAADRYSELLAGLEEVERPNELSGNRHVWHLYVVRIPRRDAVLRQLNGQGIGAGIHYPTPIHLLEPFRRLGYRNGDFPVAEAAAQEILSLPLFPGITAAQQERVVTELWKALR